MRAHKFVCKVCDKSFDRKADFKVHFQIHSAKKSYKCDLCPKTFLKKPHLEHHRLTHTGELLFNCYIYTKTFVDKSCLNYHLRTHSNDEKNDVLGMKISQCSFLPLKFVGKYFSDRHNRFHKEIRNLLKKGNLKKKSYTSDI